jgi:hypothetical protein
MRCAIHMHTTYSDGTATIPELLAVARDEGIEALLITDHDTVEARRDGWEGWHDGVLCLIGLEVSPKDGHLLAFGVDEAIAHDGLSEREICDEVTAAGGVSFAAHPFSEGSRMSRRIGRPHPWRSIEECSRTGIELWSLLTDEAERWTNPRQAVSFMRDPEPQVIGPPEEHLSVWDRLAATRRVPAIGGLDAHQPGIRLGRRAISPMPHRRFLGLLSTHVCPPRSGGTLWNEESTIDALAAGRCYLALDWIAPAAGFRFWGEANGQRLEMGGEAAAGDWSLRAECPGQADLRLLRNGEVVEEGPGRSLGHRVTGPGVWRVEAWREHHGVARRWIVSNPIYLRR